MDSAPMTTCTATHCALQGKGRASDAQDNGIPPSTSIASIPVLAMDQTPPAADPPALSMLASAVVNAPAKRISARTSTRSSTRPSTITSMAEMFSSGSEFYDEGYHEHEQDIDLPMALQLRPSDDESLFGRREELDMLHEACQKILNGKATTPSGKRAAVPGQRIGDAAIATSNSSQPGHTCPAIFVHGWSGTGKSQLVQSFLKEFAASSGPKSPSAYELRGKFEQRDLGQSSDPYSAIIQALNDFCQQVAQQSDDEHNRIKQSIKDVFRFGVDADNTAAINANTSDDRQEYPLPSATDAIDQKSSHKAAPTTMAEESSALHVLTTLVPNLKNLLIDKHIPGTVNEGHGPINLDTEHQVTNATTEISWNQLQYTFSLLIRAMANSERPIILVLDDLQWAAQASMDLLEALLMDSQIQNFVLIGIIRKELQTQSARNTTNDSKISKTDKQSNNSDNGAKYNSKLLAEVNSAKVLDPDLPLTRFLFNGSLSSSPSTPRAVLSAPPWAEIEVANWTETQVIEWLSQVMQQDVDPDDLLSSEEQQVPADSKKDAHRDEDVFKLGRYLYRSTSGNPFFIVHMLEDMQRTNHLVYSRMTFQWEWNGTMPSIGTDGHLGHPNSSKTSDHGLELDGEDEFCTGVIQLVSSKLNYLPTELRTAIILASYIKYTFDLTTLYAVIKDEQRYLATLPSPSAADHGFQFPNLAEASALSELLEQAVMKGLLKNSIGGTVYSFAHDRVQQAAYGLIPFGEPRNKLRTRIGECLLSLVDPIGINMKHRRKIDDVPIPSQHCDQSLLFIAADHLNAVPSKDCLFLANFNVRVGERAVEMAAMGPASLYLQLASNAMRKLDGDAWNNDSYDLCLRLFRARSDVELSLGHFELGHELGQEVLDRARCLEDKIPTYSSMASALGRQNRHEDCFALCRTVVKMLCPYPIRCKSYHIMKLHVKTRRYFRKHSNEDFLALPMMTDPSMLSAMKFMTNMIIRGFLCQNPQDWVLTMFIMLSFTIKYGLCVDTCLALSAYAVFVQNIGDQPSALRYADLAVGTLLRTPQNKAVGCWVYHIKSTFIEGWSESAQVVASNWHKAYTWAMEAGHSEGAMIYWHASNVSAYFNGYPIEHVLEASRSMTEQAKIFKVSTFHKTNLEIQDLLEYMSDKRVIDWDRLQDILVEDASLDGSSPSSIKSAEMKYYVMTASYVRCHMAVFFFKYELAEKMVSIFIKTSKEEPSYFMRTNRVFLMGMVAAGRFRQTGQVKYFKILCQMRKEMKMLCETRGLHSLHRALLLRAERISVSKKCEIDDVKKNYDDAILVANNSGHAYEAGFACELVGEYLLSKNRQEPVEAYFNRAFKYYTSWGGIAKAKSLQQRRPEYIKESGTPDDTSPRPVTFTRQFAAPIPWEHTKYDLISVCKSMPARDLNMVGGSKVAKSREDEEADNVSVLTEA